MNAISFSRRLKVKVYLASVPLEASDKNKSSRRVSLAVVKKVKIKRRLFPLTAHFLTNIVRNTGKKNVTKVCRNVFSK